MDNLIKNTPFKSDISPTYDNIQIIIGRVIDIVLNDKHPEFKRLGEWDALGSVFFTEVNKTSNAKDLDSLPYAKPLYSNKKYYPLKNEIVYIISFVSPQTQNNISITQYYYLDVINIWNHPHQNALPLTYNKDNQIDNSYNKNYSKGNLNQEKETSTKIDLGAEFVEKSSIKPLLPKEGDYIIESRFGSSIRFSSDKNGNPLTIIRNGQSPVSESKGWLPIKEDINNDSSSIYFSNGDNIPIEVASTNLKSFNLTSIKTTSSKLSNTQENKVDNSVSPQQNLNSFSQSFTESISLKTNLNLTSSFNLNDDFVVDENLFQESDWEKFDILNIDELYNPNPNGSIGTITQKELTDINGKKIRFNTSYSNLNFVQAVKRFYPKAQMVNEIKTSIPDFNIEIQKAVWVIFYMENSGNTFNYNGWGVQTDSGRKWIDPEKAITNQIGLREGKTGKYRSFAGFNDLKSAIRFVAFAFKRKNISILTPNLVKVYAEAWVGNTIANSTLNLLINEANNYFK